MKKLTLTEQKVQLITNWITTNNGLIDFNKFKKLDVNGLFKTESLFSSFYIKNYPDIIIKSASKEISSEQMKERIKMIKKNELKDGMWNLDTVSYKDNKLNVVPFNDKSSKILFDNSKGYTLTLFKTITDTKIAMDIQKVYRVQFDARLGIRYLVIDYTGNAHFRTGYAWIKDSYCNTAAKKKRYIVKD